MNTLCVLLLLAWQQVAIESVSISVTGELGQEISLQSNIDFQPVVQRHVATPTTRAPPPPWTYIESDPFGPSNWNRVTAACGGLYQSPINIVNASALFVARKVPLEVQGLRNVPSSIVMENEGTSVKFTPVWNPRSRPVLRGGPLKTAYLFEQLHFHWGPNNTVGSEHTLDGVSFPLEVHLVFYNGLYGSFAEAAAQVDGLAVVGFFYTITPNSNNNCWTQYLNLIREPLSRVTLPFSRSFSLHDLVGDFGWTYYNYYGSLTVPPCIETVNWIVSTKRLTITDREMTSLRSLLGFNRLPILRNYRPVLPVGGRRVFRY